MTLGLLLAGHSEASVLADLAVFAEDLGFTHVCVADERFYRDVYSLLTVMALRTRKVTLGPCVTDPYSRHPALTAAAIYTLDEISGGRAMLGFGAGISGFTEMGVLRPKPVRAIREAIELIRALASGDEVNYDGEIIKFSAGRLSFKPARATLPVWVASNGPLGQRMGAETSDAVMMESCGNRIEAEAFRRHVDKAAGPGRHVQCIVRLNLSISDDRAAALEALRLRTARSIGSGRTNFYTMAAQGLELPEQARAKVADIPYNAGAAPFAVIKDAVTDDMVRAVALAGTPQDIHDQLCTLFDAGMDGVVVSTNPAPGHTVQSTLERFVRQAWQPAQARRSGAAR